MRTFGQFPYLFCIILFIIFLGLSFMKKKIRAIYIICFFLASCINVFNKEEKVPIDNGNNPEQNNPVLSENDGIVVFTNNSKFDVNIYKNINPYSGEPFCKVNPASNEKNRFTPAGLDSSIKRGFSVVLLTPGKET